MSRVGTLRDAGRIWRTIPCNPTDGWITYLAEGVSVITWQFGDIHQCKVYIKEDDNDPKEVGICLTAQDTCLAAMKHGVKWAEHYLRSEPPTVEEIISDCFKYYPRLYRTRADVVNQLYFVIGNGYKWLRGAIVSSSPESRIEEWKRREDKTDPDIIKRNKLFQKIIDEPGISDKLKDSARRIIGIYKEDENIQRPLLDPGGPRSFYPVCKYSKVVNVPDNVRPDWLALSFEAATMLRDRSGPAAATDDPFPISEERKSEEAKEQVSNRKIGAKIVDELIQRFPQLKDAYGPT